jgi:ferredoxin-type protein NapH
MRSLNHLARHPLWRYSSFAVVALISIGGFFFPALALAVPVLMIAAITLDFFGRRSFCAGICPNGVFLATTLKPVSRMRPMPRALVRPTIRRALCGLMLVCLVGLVSRSPLEPGAIGRIFWAIYAIALSAGVLFGLLFKPRAWCVLCPLGTLQDTIGTRRKTGD